jgi:hypothetical protein
MRWRRSAEEMGRVGFYIPGRDIARAAQIIPAGPPPPAWKSRGSWRFCAGGPTWQRVSANRSNARAWELAADMRAPSISATATAQVWRSGPHTSERMIGGVGWSWATQMHSRMGRVEGFWSQALVFFSFSFFSFYFLFSFLPFSNSIWIQI